MNCLKLWRTIRPLNAIDFNSTLEFNFKVSIQSIHVSLFAVESKRKGKLVVTVQSRHDEVEVDFRMFKV